uniref:Biotin--acetyl-CoA-carboxylase ligase n=1 Tax=Herpetomonas muscarum TaxID=5718 RepID=T1YSQ3_HERMU|nr:biotin--acetyl-CoA-carboxylase ligase [Herpetomonas muscarum]
MTKFPANIEFHGSVTTTMTVAREKMATMLAGPDAEKFKMEPFGIVGESQSSGLSTGGGKWASPIGNMYFTMGIPQNNPDVLNPDVTPVLPLVCGLACRAAVLELLPGVNPEDVATKWPSSIIYKGQNIGATMVESEGDFYLAGMGMNVNVASAVSPDGRPSTTINQISYDVGAKPITPRMLAEKVWEKFLGYISGDVATRQRVVAEFDKAMDRRVKLHRRTPAGGRDPEELTVVSLNEWGHITVSRARDGKEEDICAEYLL